MSYRSFSKTISIPDYKQFDDRWGDLTTSCGGTMRVQGCAITSATMIFGIRPDVHLNEMKPYDCPYNWEYSANIKNMNWKQIYGDFYIVYY